MYVVPLTAMSPRTLISTGASGLRNAIFSACLMSVVQMRNYSDSHVSRIP